MRRSAIGFALLFCSAAAHPQPCSPLVRPFGASHFRADLLGRYPDLNTPHFRDWLDRHQGVSRWHEEDLGLKGTRRVVVETGDDRSVIHFKARVGRFGSGITQAPTYQLLQDYGNTRADALDRALRQWPDRAGISVRPVLRGRKLEWEVDTRIPTGIERFRLERTFRRKETLTFAMQSTSLPQPPTHEELASNELHHPDQFTGIAEVITDSNMTKAERVFLFVQEKYAYKDQNASAEMDKFTLADTLVRFETPASNGLLGEGLCDELSVVAISYLRRLGVPARLRLLTSGNMDAHAFVEFQGDDIDPRTSQKAWKHMDLIYGFNNPDVYCGSAKMTNVLVMLAEKPDDSRSNADCFGLPDPAGDGMLHPYDDFALSPCYPGAAEDTYSDCP